MSAIAGVVHLDGSRADGDVEAMLNAMGHRWPDGSAIVEDGPAIFGFGLMATTPEAARERLPMQQSWLVTADARVDNRAEMLGALGLTASAPDGDVVAAAVERWSLDAADRLIGDFAWAAWDERRGRLMLARDFLGLRPLYYVQDGARVAFASEVRGLLALPWVARDVDRNRLLDWRTGRYGDRTNTLLAAVKRVPAAHVVVFAGGGSWAHRYWDPTEIPVNHAMPLDAAVEGVRHHFREAVQARMRCNLPLAAHLSGGLDSSSVVATARDLEPDKRIDAYTLEFEDERFPNESHHAQEAATHSRVDLHRVASDGHGPWWNIDERIEWADAPLVTLHSSYVIGMVAEAGRRGARVMLDGSEGDDVIGHGEYLLVNHLRALRLRAARRYVHETAVRYRGTSRQRWLMFGLRPMTHGLWTRWWLHRAQQQRGPFSRESPVGGPVGPSLAAEAQARMRRQQPQMFRAIRSDERKRAENFLEPIFDEACTYLDHNYAAMGMEHRSPFFDRRLVEFCLTVPSRHRQSGSQTRWYFRRAVADVLPHAVARRTDKADFGAVAREAMRRDAPTGAQREALASWRCPGMPELFAPHVAAEPSVLLRKHILRRALERVGAATS